MELITVTFSKIASGVGPFFLLLGLLVFVHELGHYLVAVFFGVRVETFSLGFGKKLFSFKKGATTYCLSLIPLGGYVKMYGDDPSAVIPDAEKKYSFLHQPTWPRIAIVLAGPLMNLFFAILIFATIGMLGEDVPGTQLGDIDTTSAAYAAGFRSGDKILKINGQPVVQWKDVKSEIENSAGTPLTFTVSHEADKSEAEIHATPELGKNSFIFSTHREVGNIEGLATDSMSTMIGVSDPNSEAAKAGLKSFDIIESINGEKVLYWRQLEAALTKAPHDKPVKITARAYSSDGKTQPSREVTLNLPVDTKGQSYLASLGMRKSDLFLLNVRAKSPAEAAGLKNGDLVTAIDGKTTNSWQAILDRVKSFSPKENTIKFSILRDNKPMDFSIAPEKVELPTDQGGMESRYAIGVIPAILTATNAGVTMKLSNPLSAAAYGVSQSWEWTKLIAISFVRLVQNEVSARNIGGVITIGRVASKSFEVGLVAFLKMMAVISINLFLLNLLPVPVLDGGHLVFFTIEAIKGSPISFKKLEIAQQVGLVLLLSLMLFALFNDITHLISSW